MFKNLKDLHQLQSRAKEIQKNLAQETVRVEEHGIKIIMTGNQEVVSVEINPELSKQDQEKYLAQAFNQAVKKVQSLMARQMMGSGM